MARKILVTNDSTYIKKSVAELLVRRLLAEWVKANLSIRKLEVHEIPRGAKAIRVYVEAKPYIPEKMPPVDIPGVIFQEPQSPTWRMQHRGGANV